MSTRRPIRSFWLVPALLSLALVAGCASGGDPDDHDAGPQEGYATLVIRNDNAATVTVYALRAGSRQRIGTVTGLSTQRFAIRRNILAADRELRVGVDPVGSSRLYTAQPILVQEGDVIELAVSSILR